VGRVVKGGGRVIPGMVLDARAEAEALRAAARSEAAALRDAARREGLAAGRAEAAVEVASTLIAARAEAERLIGGARPAVLAIAAKMAERIVGRAVALDPTVMAEIAAQALDACRGRGGAIRLRVHPEDLAALEGSRAALEARLPEGGRLELAADDMVPRAGCVVETEVGRVDARIETQLAALERALGDGGGDG